MALLMMVALSAGFFSGLKITKDAMVNTADEFFQQQNLYDFRLYSTLGFTQEDVESFYDLAGVKEVEGMKTVDALLEYEGESKAYKIYSMPDKLNLPSLSAGRMPASDTECLVDDATFKKEDIGKVIRLADDNEELVKEQLAHKEYTIVGLIDSPLYLGLDRGSTSIGNG